MRPSSGQMFATERWQGSSPLTHRFLHLHAVWGHLACCRDFETRWYRLAAPAAHRSKRLPVGLEMVASGHSSSERVCSDGPRCVAWTPVARTGVDVLLSWTFRCHGRFAPDRVPRLRCCQAKLEYCTYIRTSPCTRP